MESQKFLKGALILSIAGFISKILGALYRIPLARIIGGEGVGLYQMAYPIYTMILAVSTAGIPVAISILVAEKEANGDYYGGKRIFLISLVMLSIIGIIFSIFLYKSSFWIADNVLNEKRAALAILAISPAIFITAINSTLRGYFQGQQTMVPTAVSQVVEQFARVTTVLALSYLLLPYGVEFSAAGATFGAVTGSIFSLIVLVMFYIFFIGKKKKRVRKSFHKKEGIFEIAAKIFYIALPLSLGGLVMPMVQLIDALIVPMRLQKAGFTIERSTELFGQLSGMANTLINLPTIITVSLAVSLVPAISELITKGNLKALESRINTALRLTLLLGLPAAAGLWVLATPISVLLYDIAEVGVSLSVLAPAALFLGLFQTTAACLQGLGKTYLPVKNLIIGAIIKVILSFYIVAIPSIGIKGAAFSSVVSFFWGFFLNYLDIKREFKIKIRWFRLLSGPFIATVVMTVVVYSFYYNFYVIFGESVTTLLAVFLGAFIYALGALLTGSVRASELALIPVVGEKIAQIALKLGIVRR